MVQARRISKSFKRGSEVLNILDGLDLDIPRGSFVSLMGPSGSGKSTLLNIIAGIDRPTSGELYIGGQRIDQLGETAIARWRATNVGFIFQAYNLLPILNAVENVELPLLLSNLPSSERRKRAETAIRLAGLESRMRHYPRQLSGGQQQRVAIARAIVTDPNLIVADEPTGDLDRTSADEILVLLGQLHKQLGKTIVMVTHDPAAAQRADQQRHMDKGKLR